MTQAFNLSQLANKVNTSGQLDASTGLVNTTPAANGGTGKSTNTAGTLLLGAGTSALTELAGSAPNQIVAWSGSAWAASPFSSVGGGDYALSAYVSPATYVKPATVKAIKVTVVGSGGNGGSTGAVPTAGISGGGGGGGSTIRYLDAPAIPSSPIAITAGVGTNSFGAFASATAGSNGTGGTSGGVTGLGGAGGTGSSGNINLPGTSGAPGSRNAFSGTSALFAAQILINVGISNSIIGGGGSGSAGTQNQTGGTGAPGIVIIEEFY